MHKGEKNAAKNNLVEKAEKGLLEALTKTTTEIAELKDSKPVGLFYMVMHENAKGKERSVACGFNLDQVKGLKVTEIIMLQHAANEFLGRLGASLLFKKVMSEETKNG